jgi:hypothetical protein
MRPPLLVSTPLPTLRQVLRQEQQHPQTVDTLTD